MTEIYTKITENLIRQFQTFKNNEINSKTLNENLVLNLSSLCKFLKGKENVTSASLDVFVPVSRLEYEVSNKIRNAGDDSVLYKGNNINKENHNDETLQLNNDDDNYDNDNDDEEIKLKKRNTLELNNLSILDNNNNNNESYFGDSILSRSIIQTRKQSNITSNNNFEYILDKT
jgi:hypothetical protein